MIVTCLQTTAPRLFDAHMAWIYDRGKVRCEYEEEARFVGCLRRILTPRPLISEEGCGRDFSEILQAASLMIKMIVQRSLSTMNFFVAMHKASTRRRWPNKFSMATLTIPEGRSNRLDPASFDSCGHYMPCLAVSELCWYPRWRAAAAVVGRGVHCTASEVEVMSC